MGVEKELHPFADGRLVHGHDIALSARAGLEPVENRMEAHIVVDLAKAHTLRYEPVDILARRLHQISEHQAAVAVLVLLKLGANHLAHGHCDVLIFLNLGIHGEQALDAARCAAGDALRLDADNRCARFGCLDTSGKAGTASAYDGNVKFERLVRHRRFRLVASRGGKFGLLRIVLRRAAAHRHGARGKDGSHTANKSPSRYLLHFPLLSRYANFC